MGIGENIGCSVGENVGSSGRFSVASVPPADWQLDPGHFISTDITGMVLEITYPQPDSALNLYAHHRNAYDDLTTSLAWEMPLGAKGGSWPHKWELTNSLFEPGSGVAGVDYPLGMSVGETLAIVGDHQEVDGSYAIVSYPVPVVGTYTLYARVQDQDGNVDTRQWTLEVDSINHRFADIVLGSDDPSTTGLIDDPVKTLRYGVWRDDDLDTEFVNKIIHYKSGTYPVEITDGPTLNMDEGIKPVTHLPYPGASVTWDFTNGKFWMLTGNAFFGAIDCDNYYEMAKNFVAFFVRGSIITNSNVWFKTTFDNMRFGGGGEWTPDTDFTIGQLKRSVDYSQFYECLVDHRSGFTTVEDDVAANPTWWQTVTLGTDNPAAIQNRGMTNDANLRYYTCVIRCVNKSGMKTAMYTGFNSEKTLLEHNISYQTEIEGYNSPFFLKFKDQHNDSTMRANIAVNFTALSGKKYGALDLGAWAGEIYDMAVQGPVGTIKNMEVCWNAGVCISEDAWKNGAIMLKSGNVNSWSQNTHVFRNAFVHSDQYGGRSLVDGATGSEPTVWSNNLLYGGNVDLVGTDGVNFIDVDNIWAHRDGWVIGTDVGTDGKLMGAKRDLHLGTHGIEVK